MAEIQGFKRSGSKSPVFARALRAIGSSTLDRSEKSVLRAMLQWWNPRTGELWPSMRSIAEASGFTVRGTQKIVRRLESRGVLIEQREPTTGTRHGPVAHTKVFRIDFAPLKPVPHGSDGTSASSATVPCEMAALGKNCEETILKNEHFSFGGEPGTGAPRTQAPTTPEPGSSEASNHEASNEIEQLTNETSRVSCSTNGCVDASSPSTARRLELVRSGIRGKMLLDLSNCEIITPELIRQEHREASRDRTCRNVPAVLVSRLASIAGIQIHKRRLLSREQIRFQEIIERRRREFGIVA